MTNDTRAAFEAWAKTQPDLVEPFGYELDLARVGRESRTEAACRGYLASRRAALEDAVQACMDYADALHTVAADAEALSVIHCIDLIRALGDEGEKL
jgi:hypothetical protein